MISTSGLGMSPWNSYVRGGLQSIDHQKVLEFNYYSTQSYAHSIICDLREEISHAGLASHTINRHEIPHPSLMHLCRRKTSSNFL